MISLCFYRGRQHRIWTTEVATRHGRWPETPLLRARTGTDPRLRPFGVLILGRATPRLRGPVYQTYRGGTEYSAHPGSSQALAVAGFARRLLCRCWGESVSPVWAVLSARASQVVLGAAVPPSLESTTCSLLSRLAIECKRNKLSPSLLARPALTLARPRILAARRLRGNRPHQSRVHETRVYFLGNR